MSTRIKWNYDLVLEKLNEIHGDKYDYSKFTHYENLWQQIEVKCKIHDIIFTPYLSNHIKKGTGCPKCGISKSSKTRIQNGPFNKFEDYIERFNEIHKNKYKYDQLTYKGSITEMKMICPEHGVFWQKPSNHLQGKGCPDCGTESMKLKLRYNDEEISTLLENQHDYKFDISTYIGTKQPMKFICPEHGEFWQRPMNQLRQDAGCPKCSTSKAEKELISLFPTFKHRDRDLINPLEIDLVDYQNKFGIEFNGNIWHSFGKTFPNNSNKIIKDKHSYKTDQVEKQGFQLFHILDIDWNNPIKKRIWLSVIDSKLGKTERIFARNTKLVDLTKERNTVKSFLKNNHLQGYSSNYKLAYGLINKHGRLISIMTFGKPIEDSSEWEIKRFCTSLNTTICGGASKLLTNFERIHKPTSILSYAKRDWSVGNVYEKLGFTLVGKTEPSKFFIKNNIKYSRQKFQKQKLNDRLNDGLLEHLNGSTAQEILFNNGYRVLYDSGNLKYIKLIK